MIKKKNKSKDTDENLYLGQFASSVQFPFNSFRTVKFKSDSRPYGTLQDNSNSRMLWIHRRGL